MTSNYIRALALRHAALDHQIEIEMKAPLPDTLKIMRLKKLKLACRDTLSDAISRKRKARSQRKSASARISHFASSPRPPQMSEEA